ncbi:MAG: hypothetical protein JW941_00550, partial [Candidatus Coatesbacteria bacterium]|nr:hypothetical protein [Candidatus Coatesbacteria bacterium]
GVETSPRSWNRYYYLIAVNATDSPISARFDCNWVPGFKNSEGGRGAMEVWMPPVEVLFEPGIGGGNRQIFIEEPGMVGRPQRSVVFHDSFAAHERHVYMIPAQERPWWVIQFDDCSSLILERLQIGPHP